MPIFRNLKSEEHFHPTLLCACESKICSTVLVEIFARSGKILVTHCQTKRAHIEARIQNHGIMVTKRDTQARK